MRNAPCFMAVLISPLAIGASDGHADRFVKPLGIHLLVDGIDEVLRSFGPAPITAQEHYERAVCYLWPNALARYTIGDEGIGASFELSQRPSSVPKGCVAVKKSASGTILEVAGLRLGMKEEDFIAIIGNKTETRDGWRIARFSWTEKLPDNRGRTVIDLSVNVGVEGEFLHGLLTALRIWKSAST